MSAVVCNIKIIRAFNKNKLEKYFAWLNGKFFCEKLKFITKESFLKKN